jgi:site-specific DNA-cytosine methylase
MKCLDLFTGIGGMGRLLPLDVIMYCENADFPRRVLERRIKSGDLPDAPIHDDITTLLDPPDHDILIGGFPCTDICRLGLQKGLSGKKSGLYYEILRIVRAKKPKYIFLENVKHIVHLPSVWKVVLTTLSEAAYDMQWCVFGANNHGAFHRRNRWFILANYTGVSKPKVADMPNDNMHCFGQVRSGKYKELPDPKVRRYRMKEAYTLKALEGVRTKAKVTSKVFKRTLWVTPRATCVMACTNMSERSICDLPSQLRFASTTPDRDRHLFGNLKWVENLMGLPANWTDPDSDKVEDFPGFGVEIYTRMKPRNSQKNYNKRWKCLGNSCVSQTALIAYNYLMHGKLVNLSKSSS